MDSVRGERPDSCNGEFPWPRQWDNEHLAPAIVRRPAADSAGLVVAKRGYVMADGKRRNALVKATSDRGPEFFPLIGVNLPTLVGHLERGEAEILRDLLNEVLEATTP